MQNTVKANQLKRRYDIVFLPTMLIVDANGIVKYQVDRELSTSELLSIGQKSLDPSSYHISDATAIRRNSNELVVAQKPEPHPTNKPFKTATVPEKTEATTSAPPLSTSQATRRARLLDSYETVDESSQKVLAVLGAGEMPPEVLLQEAYLRVEFMDGSHKQAAKNYLATQENWDTEINRKFILDFVNNASSPEYEFIIGNREKFNTQFGDQKIKKTLEILTYRALYNGVPRPTLEESIQLYSNLGVKEPYRQGYNYFISRLITENKVDEVIQIGNQYLASSPNDHEFLYTIARFLANRTNRTDEDLQTACRFMQNANSIYPESLIYLDLLGNIYIEQGNTKRAQSTYLKAIQEAKKQGKDSKVFEEKGIMNN